MKPSKRTAELLSDLVDRIETCHICHGSGLIGYRDQQLDEACPACGGIGKELDATALIQEIEEVKDLLK